MKKLVVIVIFILASVWLWNRFPEEESSAVSTPRVETKKKKAAKKKAVAVVPTVPAPMAPPAQVNAVALPPPTQTRQIPKDHLEFELLGNRIAVAFGDIVLGRLETEIKTSRGLFKPPKSRLWPSNVIPFVMQDGLPNPQNVMDALKYFNENTNMQFIAKTDEAEGIVFTPWDEKRCASYVGRVENFQPIFVGPNCSSQDILHELMHALGFVHEQSRTDRDNYVRVLWDNILDGFQNQFDMVPDAYIHPYTGSVFNFDYESVMLYRPEAFAKSPTVKTLEAVGTGKIAPVTQGLSARDLERLHYLYGN